MKKNVLLMMLVVAVAGLAAVVVWQRGELNRLREIVKGKPVDFAAAPAHPVATALPAPEPEPELPPAPPVAQPQAAAPAPAASETNAPNMFARMGEMAKDPAFKNMIRAQQKMMLDMSYGGLFKKLNLSTEDLDALKQLIVDRQMALVDGGMAMMGGELSPADRAEKGKEIQKVKAEYDKKIEDFLGADDYVAFKDYEETQSERVQVNMFKQSLGTGEALTEQQEADLVEAMYQMRKSLPDPDFMQKTNPDPSRFTEAGVAEMQKQLDQLHEKYVQSAGSVLNATQLEQFKKSLEQLRAMQAMSLKMAGQMFGQQKQTPTAPKP